jgi:mono/diheme cytochrome c family protein
MNAPVPPILSLAAALVLASCGSAESAVPGNPETPAGAPRKSALAMATDPGQRTYLRWCAPCHAPGTEHPGTNAIAAKYEGSRPGALVDQADLDPGLIKAMVRGGISVMPPFRKTEISDPELDALATWLAAQGKKRK